MTAGPLRHAGPDEVGLPEDLSARLDAATTRGLAATGIPGAAVLLVRRGVVVHHGAHGWAQDHDVDGVLAAPRPVRRDTVFDIASITKVVATTAVVMWLVDHGLLDLDDPVERHLRHPGRLAGRGLTVRHLLEHRGGLPAWQPLYLWARDRDAAVTRIGELEPGEVGVRRVYSDLGMMLLGAVVEHAGDAPLDELVAHAVVAPLGLVDTGYLPGAARRRRCAATSTGNRTEQRMIATGDPVPVDGAPGDFAGWRRHTLVGEVNDGNAAYAFGGVAGHAGLFSTAADLAVFGQALVDGGRCGGTEAWRTSTVERFTRAGADPDQGLGFWRRRLTALGAALPSDASFGHRGFTGCELVVDPERDLVLVLLSNRLHTEEDPPTDPAPLWAPVVRAALAGWGPTV